MREIRTLGTCLVILALAVLPLCCRSAAQTGSHTVATPKSLPTPSELFKRLSASVFVVESLDSKGTTIALGSGVSIAKDEVVTNRHVVEEGKSWQVRRGDNIWAAKIAYLDSKHDLCGLWVAGLNAAPVTVRPSSTLSVGDRVYALGNPEGLQLSLSEGLVSGLRKFEGVSLIQTTAPISHGSSGGGLFDSQGELVGVTTFVMKDGQNLNFALPTEWVLGLKEHPSTEVRQTDVEKNVSQAMLLSEVAQDALDSDNYEKALETYKQVSELVPGDTAVWLLLGEIYLKLKQPDSARQACEKAVQLSPEQGDGWACLGDVYERLGQYPQAEEALKKALDLDPSQQSQTLNLFELGIVFAEEGKRMGVMSIYERLGTLDQNWADRFYQQYVRPMLDSPER